MDFERRGGRTEVGLAHKRSNTRTAKESGLCDIVAFELDDRVCNHLLVVLATLLAVRPPQTPLQCMRTVWGSPSHTTASRPCLWMLVLKVQFKFGTQTHPLPFVASYYEGSPISAGARCLGTARSTGCCQIN